VNDLKDVLGLALDTSPAAGTPADPRADLARGRRMLWRRRAIGATGVLAAMAIGALVPLALTGGAAPSAHQQAARVHQQPVRATRSPSAVREQPKPDSVKLVAWTGTQPPGYEVNWMPTGWVVQGSTPFALVIAPHGDSDTNADSFLGKLVVMLQSASVTSPPPGTAMTVDGRAAVFQTAAQAGGDTEILTFKAANGQWVVVQAPMALGWSSAQLAKFCGGVTVLAAAQQGVG
jgi:hypothetical protein